MKPYVVVSKDGALGTLRCPKRACKGEFTVNREKFKMEKYRARPCPYCFKCSYVPGRENEEE